MVVHLLGHSSAQNDSKLEGTLYVALESRPNISFQGELKNAQKCEEKDAFYAAVDDPLDSAVNGCPLRYI